MSTKKEIWRLLEPGDVWQEGDQFWARTIKCEWRYMTILGESVIEGEVGRRRMTLPEPQGWISVKERMPTKEDAGHRGCILWLFESEAMIAAPWDKDWGHEVKYSHWATIPPNSKKDSDEEAWEEWSKKNLMRNYSVGNAEADAALKEGFMAGRKSVATDGGSHG